MAAKLSGFKKVAVIKIANELYYCALYDDDIHVGDQVLVTGAATNIYKVYEIISADEARLRFSKNIIAEVKCKVDLSAYEKRVANRALAEKLRKEMDKKIEEMDEMNKYVMYAEKNPEIAKMLEEYRELI